MLSYLVIGECKKCSNPTVVPTFSTKPVEPIATCSCSTSKKRARFSKLVTKLKGQLFLDPGDKTVVLLSMGVIFGQLQSAVLSNNKKKLRRCLADLAAVAWRFGEQVSDDL